MHLASSGFPIIGDKIYRGNGSEYLEWMANGLTPELGERLILPRHALHAAVLEIQWDGLPVRWVAPLSRDMQEFLEGKTVSSTPDVVIWCRHD